MSNGEEGNKELFTKHSLGQLSGAVAMTYMATIVLYKLFNVSQLLLGLFVAFIVSLGNWVYTRVSVKSGPKTKKPILHKVGFAFLAILVIISNTFLILMSATGASDFVADLTFDETSVREGETQSRIAWAGHTQADTEISYLAETSEELETDLSFMNAELDSVTEELEEASDELEIIRRTDRGEAIVQIDSLSAINREFEIVISAQTDNIERLEQENSELTESILVRTNTIESLGAESSELQLRLSVLENSLALIRVELIEELSDHSDLREAVVDYTIILQEQHGIVIDPDFVEIIERR